MRGLQSGKRALRGPGLHADPELCGGFSAAAAPTPPRRVPAASALGPHFRPGRRLRTPVHGEQPPARLGRRAEARSQPDDAAAKARPMGNGPGPGRVWDALRDEQHGAARRPWPRRRRAASGGLGEAGRSDGGVGGRREQGRMAWSGGDGGCQGGGPGPEGSRLGLAAPPRRLRAPRAPRSSRAADASRPGGRH